jgi:hypothetical protein
MKDVGIFYGHLVYFKAILYILWQLGKIGGYLPSIFFPVLVCCTKKNVATPGRYALCNYTALFSGIPLSMKTWSPKPRLSVWPDCERLYLMGNFFH